jgi:hypothetical protein
MALNFFGDTYMNHVLVSKLIFQHFILTGLSVINSTQMLKALIIAYLTENSIYYTDSDIEVLTVEVKKFLTVEDVTPTNVSNSQAAQTISLSETDKRKLCEFIEASESEIKRIKKLYSSNLTSEVIEIIEDFNNELTYEETSNSDLVTKADIMLDFLESSIYTFDSV